MRATHEIPTGAKEIAEPAKMLPVLMQVDVAVVGGGVAGIAAAVAAARNGAKTVLIERDGCLGGTATTGLMVVFMGVDFDVLTGTCRDFLERMAARKGAMIGSNTPFDPEVFKSVAEEWLTGHGVQLLYHAWFADVIVRDETVAGVVVELKEGRRAILARQVIDATGDADVVAAAGAPFEKSPAMQPVTSIFRVDHVDLPQLIAYIENNPDQFYNEQGQKTWRLDNDPPFFTIGGFFDLIKKARDQGELDLPHESIWLGPLPRQGELFINTTRVQGVDGTSSLELSRAEVETKRQAWSVWNFLRKHVPGFARAEMVDIAVRMGVRETRRAIGEYVLTKEDLLSGRRFPDAIAMYNFPMDVHGPRGQEEGHGWTVVRNAYDIPFRALIPKGFDGLLVSGRCISSDHEAHGSTRAMPCCMATGEAAGTAAAIASRKGLSARDVNREELRRTLKAQGVMLRD